MRVTRFAHRMALGSPGGAMPGGGNMQRRAAFLACWRGLADKVCESAPSSSAKAIARRARNIDDCWTVKATIGEIMALTPAWQSETGRDTRLLLASLKRVTV